MHSAYSLAQRRKRRRAGVARAGTLPHSPAAPDPRHGEQDARQEAAIVRKRKKSSGYVSGEPAHKASSANAWRSAGASARRAQPHKRSHTVPTCRPSASMPDSPVRCRRSDYDVSRSSPRMRDRTSARAASKQAGGRTQGPARSGQPAGERRRRRLDASTYRAVSSCTSLARKGLVPSMYSSFCRVVMGADISAQTVQCAFKVQSLFHLPAGQLVRSVALGA